MPSQTPTPIALPIPRKRSPLLAVTTTLGQDDALHLTNSLASKANSPYTFITRFDDENDYSPPAPPPPSPVNFPSGGWSTGVGGLACVSAHVFFSGVGDGEKHHATYRHHTYLAQHQHHNDLRQLLEAWGINSLEL